MHSITNPIRRIALACALCAAAGSALAQGASKESLGIIKKEINAAYAEQKAACAKGARSERASCLDQARQIHRKDMANAGKLVADAPTGGINERIVTTVEPGGAGAVGSSQGGATASGGDGASGSSGSGISASGGGTETPAAPTGNAGAGVNGAAGGQAQPIEPQPMQPPSVSTPPRSQDTPIQR